MSTIFKRPPRRDAAVARTALTVLLATALALPGFAVTPDEMLKDPALEARARDISQHLRCVVCQNQSIDDSNAPLAHDLRVLVRDRLTAGDTDAQALDFIVARYGNFVLLKPPVQGDTLFLWAGPFVFLLLAGLAFRHAVRRQQNAAVLEPVPDLTEAERRHLETLTREGPKS